MYKDKTVAVVIPAYNEEKLIGSVIETLPELVDRIIVIDDCSQDSTVARVQAFIDKQPDRILLLQHRENQGVGGAIATGYRWCRDENIDIAVVMAGDAQMDPADLPSLIDPVADGSTDYSKGNRLITGEAWHRIPKVRYLGNSMLSLLTKIASGYWHIADSQSGYTAINSHALKRINWDQMYKRFGQPNDLLVTLNINGFRVSDVEVRPIYGIGEKSGINPIKIIPKLSWLILRLFVKRMIQKYVIRDFHPLVLFYFMGIFLLILDIPLLARFFILWNRMGTVPEITLLGILFCTVSGIQLVLFAMLFDMEANQNLRGANH